MPRAAAQCASRATGRCSALAAALLLLQLALRGQACTVITLQNDGFATNALYLLRAATMFYRQNGTVYVDSTDFPYACSQDGGFHDFFKYDEHLVPWSAAKEAAAGDACARVSFAEIDNLVFNVLKVPHYHLELIGVQRAWWYRKWVWEWIRANRMAPLERVAAPTIAFHVRGGDIFEYDNERAHASTMPADYIRAFKHRYPGVKGGTCVFTGDQYDLLLQAGEAAQQALGCAPVFGAAFPLEEGFARDGFAELDLDARCEATLQLLGDMEVLARADYFVSSYNSRWGRLVEWLRYGLYHKDRATSVDASADHADLFSAIHGLFRRRDEVQQGSAEFAGEVGGELTELELEEIEALEALQPKGAGQQEGAAAGAGTGSSLEAKGSQKAKKKKKNKASDAQPTEAVEGGTGAFMEAAGCKGQECGHSSSPAEKEGAWEGDDATADDEQYVSGSAGRERLHGIDGIFVR